MKQNQAYILAATVLFVLTLLMGTLPVYLIESISNKLSKRKQQRKARNAAENIIPAIATDASITTITTTTTNTNAANSSENSSSNSSSSRNSCNQIKNCDQTSNVVVDDDNDDNNSCCGTKFTHWLKKILIKDRIVQFLAQLGGGVLLYTAFIHMLPEIRENYESYLKNKQNGTKVWEVKVEEDKDDDDPLPVVDLCACAGFFGIFLIEELMHTFFLKNHDHHNMPNTSNASNVNAALASVPNRHHHHYYAQHHNNDIVNTTTNVKSNNPLSQKFSSKLYMQPYGGYKTQVNEQVVVNNKISNNDNENSGGGGNSQKSTTTNGKRHLERSEGTATETYPISTCQMPCYDSCEKADNVIDNKAIGSRCDVENISNFEQIISENRTICARIFDALLMILAFSCHAIFDGISIGVQKGNNVWTLLIAILSHKLLIAFILSMQIYERCFQTMKYSTTNPDALPERKPMKRAKLILWLFSTLFALMSPIGIFIVMAMGSDANDAPTETQLHIIVLAAISAGTIVYIVFLEIIDKSSSRTHLSGLVQWIALCLGFGLMHLVTVLFKE